MKNTLLAVATLFFLCFTAQAQDTTPKEQPLTLEQIAKQAPIGSFIPDAKAAEKLTPEEQEAIKLHMAKFMSAAMAQSYKKGAEDSSAFLLKEFDKFAAEQQRRTAQRSTGARLAVALQAFGEGMSDFRQSVVLENARRINCVSSRIGNFTYTNCY
jgi:hypothetical protein